jgi:hypothetical protein
MRIATLARCGLAVTMLCLAVSAEAQRPVELAPNAPPDRTVGLTLQCQARAMLRAIAPLAAAAKTSFPAARQRFEEGLPPRHTFFVSTWLYDTLARRELVFVAVDSVVGLAPTGFITGRIWSSITVVRGYAYRHSYRFPISELVDWMVARPDGTEEGNHVGKFLDTYVPPTTCDETGDA